MTVGGDLRPSFATAGSPRESSETIHRLVVTCADQPGIVSAVSQFLFSLGANIVHSDQHSSDPSNGTFFLRMEFTAPNLQPETFDRDFEHRVAAPFVMTWQRTRADAPKRLGILVSKADHCLLDLLWRVQRGDLEAQVSKVVSNHMDLAWIAEAFGAEFHHVPVRLNEKAEAEEALLELLADCDVVVLARYMQILSGRFLERLARPVINVHHSLLPAFAGANPYERAKGRGVKLIGATAHYVTEELDAGPIISQDVTPVSHRESTASLKRRGADIERVVLSRAVAWHCEDRVIVHDGATVIF